MKQIMQHADYDVQHEKFGTRGTISSVFCVDDFYYPGAHDERFCRVEFKHIFHQVRHPLAAIPSLANSLKDKDWHWQEKHTGISGDHDPPLERAAHLWLVWNQIVEGLSPELRYRIEDVEEAWPEITARLGISAELPNPLPKAGKAKGSKRAQISDFHDRLAQMIKNAARRYGYAV